MFSKELQTLVQQLITEGKLHNTVEDYESKYSESEMQDLVAILTTDIDNKEIDNTEDKPEVEQQPVENLNNLNDVVIVKEYDENMIRTAIADGKLYIINNSDIINTLAQYTTLVTNVNHEFKKRHGDIPDRFEKVENRNDPATKEQLEIVNKLIEDRRITKLSPEKIQHLTKGEASRLIQVGKQREVNGSTVLSGRNF